MWRVTRRMSSTDESLFAGGGESSPADSIHTEDGAAKTISEERGEELMIQLKRIKSESVVQQIIDSLVEAMIRKELKPGDQIIYGIILDKAGSYEYLMELREIMEAGVMKLAMENGQHPGYSLLTREVQYDRGHGQECGLHCALVRHCQRRGVGCHS